MTAAAAARLEMRWCAAWIFDVVGIAWTAADVVAAAAAANERDHHT